MTMVFIILLGAVTVFSIRSVILARNGASLILTSSIFPTHFSIGSIENPAFNLMILGDSTAVGTGTERIEQTVGWKVATWIAEQGFYVHVENRGENFAKYSTIITNQLSHSCHADLTIVLAGANDALRPEPIEVFKKKVDICFKLLDASRQVLITEAPDLGATRAFLPPLSSFHRTRVRLQNTLVKECAAEHGYLLADLYPTPKQVGQAALASDLLHPNPTGYSVWAEVLITTLEQINILKNPQRGGG